MDAGMNMLQDTAHRIFAAHLTTALRVAAEAGTAPAALWQAIEDAGLPAALLPESAGGFGIGAAEALSLLSTAGHHAAPVPLAETMLAGWLLATAALPMPPGMLTIAPIRPAEPLTLHDDNTLTGTATRIPWGRDATHIAVLAQRGPTPHICLAPPSSYTVTPGQNLAREPRDTIAFHGPALAAAPTTTTLTNLRALGAAMRAQQIAGCLGRVVEMTVQYAQDRIQFGRPIAKFQAIQHNLAILAAQHAAAVAAAAAGADAVQNGLPLLPIAAAKSRTGEAASLAAALAHQIHGAIGFTYEHALHFQTKRLWSWRDEFGKDSEWNALIGRHLATAGADSLWPEITAA